MKIHVIAVRFFILMSLVLPFAAAASAQKGATMTIKIFLSNDKLNPNIDDCNKVFPVTRKIPKTAATAKAALAELFKGPTKDEEAKGYSGLTAAETDGILKSINVKNGAAYVNFTSRVMVQMGNSTTSCGGGQYWGMFDETLMQFPTIKKVYYAVEGIRTSEARRRNEEGVVGRELRSRSRRPDADRRGPEPALLDVHQ